MDCFDGIDELNCRNKSSTPIVCNSNEFSCTKEQKCIPLNQKCDGMPDCVDGEDEDACPHSLYCTYPNRVCKSDKGKDNSTCIPVTKLCDGSFDCMDGSDEGDLCRLKQCETEKRCSHFCHNTPEGFICSCPFHLFLQSDKLTCNENHACSYWGVCSQRCVQNGREYECSCVPGYSLESDQFTCKSNNPDTPYVIYTTPDQIKGVNLKTMAAKSFYSGLRNTIALDFLITNGSVEIFWTDVKDDKIYR